MALSNQSVETLLDLLEIKISQMDVFDRDDARELRQLERARDELGALCPERRAVAPQPAMLRQALPGPSYRNFRHSPPIGARHAR